MIHSVSISIFTASQQPFNVQFITDATSPTSPATPGKAGFRLTYFQTVCTT